MMQFVPQPPLYGLKGRLSQGSVTRFRYWNRFLKHAEPSPPFRHEYRRSDLIFIAAGKVLTMVAG